MVDIIDNRSLRLLRHPFLCLRLWYSQQLRQDREPVRHCLCDILGERADPSHAALRDDSQLHEILPVHLFDLFVHCQSALHLAILDRQGRILLLLFCSRSIVHDLVVFILH